MLEAPATIHLVGAQRTNYPWGFENRLIPALERLGFRVLSTDYRQQRAELPALLRQPADLVLVCKGEGISPEVIRPLECPTVLWYAEQVGTEADVDATARIRREELAGHGPAFDYVFTHESASLRVYQRLGCTRVGCLPTAAVDPEVFRPLGIERDLDVVFVGTMTPRRRSFLDALARRIPIETPQVWEPTELNRLFNRARIVLNLHLSEIPNTETRLCEAAGAGALVVTETPSMRDLLEEGRHAVFFPVGDVGACAAALERLLADETGREAIAGCGCAHVHARHTLLHRLQTLLAVVEPDLKRRRWPAPEIGVLRDKWGEPTARICDFQAAVENQLARAGLDVAASAPWPAPESLRPPASPRAPRRLRIFAAFGQVNWENANLQPALEELGEVVRFDWSDRYSQYSPDWHFGGKQRMNEELLAAVEKAHRSRPIDVFFGYVSGRLVFPGVLWRIRRWGIPTLGMCLDDELKFEGPLEPTGHAGMIDLAAAFSLCWTSSRSAIEKYRAAGGRALFLPPGANEKVFRPCDVEQDVDVGFIGQCYGVRPERIAYLRRRGVDAKAFGKGWESGELPMEEVVRLFSRCKIVLGVGAVADRSDVLTIKGRDFEATMSGAFYLTEPHSDLSEFFQFGEEIETYRTQEEMLEKVRFYLANPQRREAVRRRGLERSLREHTWTARFLTAFRSMGLAVAEGPQ